MGHVHAACFIPWGERTPHASCIMHVTCACALAYRLPREVVQALQLSLVHRWHPQRRRKHCRWRADDGHAASGRRHLQAAHGQASKQLQACSQAVVIKICGQLAASWHAAVDSSVLDIVAWQGLKYIHTCVPCHWTFSRISPCTSTYSVVREYWAKAYKAWSCFTLLICSWVPSAVHAQSAGISMNTASNLLYSNTYRHPYLHPVTCILKQGKRQTYMTCCIQVWNEPVAGWH